MLRVFFFGFECIHFGALCEISLKWKKKAGEKTSFLIRTFQIMSLTVVLTYLSNRV